MVADSKRILEKGEESDTLVLIQSITAVYPPPHLNLGPHNASHKE